MVTDNYYLKKGYILKNQYVISDYIGSGGFGITYKALDSATGNVVAIKELFPRDTVIRDLDGESLVPQSEENLRVMNHCIARFYQEANSLRTLQNVREVVNILDSFYQNNTVYIVMPYLNGVTLRTLIKKHGRINLKPVLDILDQVGKGLSQVHAMGLYHRDISPDNIMITGQGKAVLIDFGNAKQLAKVEYELKSVIIKIGYAPLEQYYEKGKQGTWTDVYALAFTLYHALTGLKPPGAPERQNNNEYEPLYKFGFPRALSDAFDHALKLRWMERTQTIEQFVAEVHAALDQQGEKAEPWVTDMPKNPVIDGYIHNEYLGSLRIKANETVKVGRDGSAANFIMKEEHVSALHCEVFYSSEERLFFVEDHSSNGTYAGGRKLPYKVPVVILPGEKLMLGSNLAAIVLREE